MLRRGEPPDPGDRAKRTGPPARPAPSSAGRRNLLARWVAYAFSMAGSFGLPAAIVLVGSGRLDRFTVVIVVVVVTLPRLMFELNHHRLVSRSLRLSLTAKEVGDLMADNAHMHAVALPPDRPPAGTRPAITPETHQPATLPLDLAAFPAGTFLGELGAAYVAELTAIGHDRAFASGEIVFREGAPADHVLLITEGRARVAVKSDGATRGIATRGPGDVIGERAASLGTGRSATVVATSELRGIRIDADAFSAFLGRHPQAMKVLEGQLYDRMTTQRSRGGLNGQSCTVLMLDIVRFSDMRRTDADRMAMIDAYYPMLRNAIEDSGISWEECHREDRGDGVLVVFPEHVPPANVVSPLLRTLADSLDLYNRQATRHRLFRLRAAIDIGPITEHEHGGVGGETIISASRLLDAAELREAVNGRGVVLGFITSAYVHDRVIRHLEKPGGYTKVEIDVKGFPASARMHMFRRTRR